MSQNLHGWLSNPRLMGPWSIQPTPAKLTSILTARPEEHPEEEELAADEMSDGVDNLPGKSKRRLTRKERTAIRNASCSKTNSAEETTEPLAAEDSSNASKTVEDDEKPKETVAEEMEALRQIMKTVDVTKIPVESLYLMETQFTRCLKQPDKVNPCMTTREFVNLLVKAKTADENETLLDEDVNEEDDPEIFSQ